jgi:phosphatidylethanolamine/phosphatidyl-N-methylethanolamine N-methyltransferase
MATRVEAMQTAGTKAYDRWAPVYDLVFGRVFETGRALSIAAAERVGGRVLEVGVGTA